MNICVVGTGYVGLVTGAVFADLGNDVVCVDNVPEKVEMLKRGEMPIYEPGLKEMVVHNMKDGRLFFTTDLSEGVTRSEVIFIAVGTPPKENGETDLSQVEDVAHGIARSLDRYKIIVNKSTVPVGTGDLVRDIIERNKRRNVDFDVVSNPEFLREGSAIQDSLFPDRIVIGAPSQTVAMTLLELYASLERPMLITDVHSAEIIKYASNAFLATKISFINTMADLCEEAGADVTHVVKGMGYDRRIGPEFLNPGLGFGGSCFPKDVDSLIYTSQKMGIEADLLMSVMSVNRKRAQHFVDIITERMGSLDDKTFAVLGLAFKQNTDDIREAKSLEIIKLLLKAGAKIKAYDPVAMDNCRRIQPEVNYCKSTYEAMEDADALLIVTEWNEFKFLNMEKIKSLLNQPVIFDGRNLYQKERMKRLGFEYYSIGR
ncbi:UDP-glucose/GDP-mannose dehydrogenase family protein [bacterium]|nr:UDP-glucose/GDP-mannose dehydrogenase family protein [bacterium]